MIPPSRTGNCVRSCVILLHDEQGPWMMAGWKGLNSSARVRNLFECVKRVILRNNRCGPCCAMICFQIDHRSSCERKAAAIENSTKRWPARRMISRIRAQDARRLPSSKYRWDHVLTDLEMADHSLQTRKTPCMMDSTGKK